ncbi:MAG TPA: HEPN domain-containing protein [Syntrophorhabdaceae bacterium]|nr:HEPN domain-containing protein [Syntrophorhabdaceae bacterium]
MVETGQKGYTSIMTHLLKELARECVKHEEAFSTILGEAKNLDMYYIPTRYPNGLGGDLAPAEFYEKEDAERCINSAESILKVVMSLLKR